jgi:protein gp37
MPDNAEILWAHHTLNFWMGCEKVSAECTRCYISRGLFWGGRQPYGAVYRTALA